MIYHKFVREARNNTNNNSAIITVSHQAMLDKFTKLVTGE